jgi:hypothetical protein
MSKFEDVESLKKEIGNLIKIDRSQSYLMMKRKWENIDCCMLLDAFHISTHPGFFTERSLRLVASLGTYIATNNYDVERVFLKVLVKDQILVIKSRLWLLCLSTIVKRALNDNI